MDALGDLVPLGPGGAPGQAGAQALHGSAPRAVARALRAQFEPAPGPVPSNPGHRSTEVSPIRAAAREPSEAMDALPATPSEMDQPASMPWPQVVPSVSAMASVRRSDGVSALQTPGPRAAPAAPTGTAPSAPAPLAAPAMPDQRVEAVQRPDAAALPAKPGAVPAVTGRAPAPLPLPLPLPLPPASPLRLPLLPAGEAEPRASMPSPLLPVAGARADAPRSPAVRRRARAQGKTPHDPAPGRVEAQAAWPWPSALPSHQAPLSFVVNLLLEEGLYPDFTRPLDPGLPVPLWALLPALARAWRLPPDPLASALANRAPDWSPPGDFEVWLAAFARQLRRRLCRRLHWRVSHLAPGLTLREPARVWLSEAEIVAQFPLERHDIAWRLAGLDRDPGWLPSAGC